MMSNWNNFELGDLTPKEIEDLMFECHQSTDKFSMTFFPERFSKPFSSLHNQIWEVIDATKLSGGKQVPKHQFVVIKAPRGLGKTSSVANGWAAKQILYVNTYFLMYLSKNLTHAETTTESIRRSLMTNQKVKAVFGDISTRNRKDLRQFSKLAWTTQNGVLCFPRGAGQNTRGFLQDQHRPSRFVIDDLEDSKTIDNEEQRQKTYEWLNEDVLYARELGGDDFQFIYIDTKKHEDSVLQRLIDDPMWTSLELSICDENYESLAPEFISTEQVKDLVVKARENGTLDSFAQEMMGLSVSHEDKSFQSNMFKYYNEYDPEFLEELQKGELISFVIVDYAKTVKMHAADNAIVGVSVNRITGKIYLRQIVAGRFYPDDLYATAIMIARELDAHHICAEVTGLGEFIIQPFTQAIKDAGGKLEFHPLRARKGEGEFTGRGGGKKMRVASLLPSFRKGIVFFNKVCAGLIETQLLSFPKSKKWDVMDAFGYITQIIDDFYLYFMIDESSVASDKELEEEDALIEEMDNQEDDLDYVGRI